MTDRSTVYRAAWDISREDWQTPRALFAELHREFRFTIDVAASPDNAMLPRYITPEQDALTQDWSGERCWLNPPYGRGIDDWITKAQAEYRRGALVVCLIPARTDAGWWHDYAMRSSEVRFIRGRIRFGGAPFNAPFTSALVIFDPAQAGLATRYRSMKAINDR